MTTGNSNCPKCGSPRIVRDDYKHAPAVKCQLCGWRLEGVMQAWNARNWRETTNKPGEGRKHMKPCRSCGKLVDCRSQLYREKSLCRRCDIIANWHEKDKRTVAA